MPGQVTGIIGNQDVVLENAATESTLELLVQSMEKIAKGLGIKGKDYAKELANLKKEAEAREYLVDVVVEEEKTRSKHNVQLDKGTVYLKKMVDVLYAFSTSIGPMLTRLFSDAAPSIGSFSNVLGDAVGKIPLIGRVVGPVITALGGVLEKQIVRFRELSTAGVDLGHGMFAAQAAATRASLPLEVLAKVVKNNSDQLALLGGTASQGALRFVELSRNMRRSGFDQQLARLGFSMEEAADAQMSYIELMNRSGRASRMSTAQLTAGAMKYSVELDKLARATGLQRKEIDNAIMAASRDARMRISLIKLNETERNRVIAKMAQLDKLDPTGKLSAGFKDIIAGGGVALTTEAKMLALQMQQAGVNLPQIAKDMFMGVKGSADKLDFSIAQLARSGRDLTDGQRLQSSALITLGKDFPMLMALLAAGADDTANSYKLASAETKSAMGDTSKNIAGLDRTLTDLQNTMQNMVIKTGVFDKFSSALTGITNQLNALSKGNITDAVKTLIEKSVDITFKYLKDKVSSIDWAAMLKPMLPGLIGAIGVGLALVFAKFAGGKLIDSVSGSKRRVPLPGASLPPIPGDRSLPGGKQTSDGIGSKIGQGIGGALGGVLEGLAKGLSSLGTPKVAVGVLALAGIAGTMYIAAKSFQQFARVSWEDVGKGVVAVLGLGALGAVAGAIGPLLVTGAIGIGALGLALIPFAASAVIAAPALDQIIISLAKLSEVDMGKAAMMGPTLIGIGAGLGALGAGSLIDSVLSGLGRLFGADSPIEKIQKLGKEATNIQMLSFALKTLDFNKLDASGVNLDALSAIASRIEDLAESLADSDIVRITDRTAESLDGFTAVVSKTSAFQQLAVAAGNVRLLSASLAESRFMDFAPAIAMLNTAIAQLDVSRLDTSDVSFENFYKGTYIVRDLSISIQRANFPKMTAELNNFSVALKKINFKTLDASKVNFNSLTIASRRVKELTTSLANARAEMSKITNPTLSATITSTFDKLVDSFSSLINPETEETRIAREQITVLTAISTKLETLNNQVYGLNEMQRQIKASLDRRK